MFFYLVDIVIDGEEVIDPGLDARLDRRRFELLVSEIGQLAEFVGRRLQTGQARLQLARVALRHRTPQSRLDLVRQVLLQRLDALDTRFDIV